MFETKTRPGCKLASGVNENRVNFILDVHGQVYSSPLISRKKAEHGLPVVHSLSFS